MEVRFFGLCVFHLIIEVLAKHIENITSSLCKYIKTEFARCCSDGMHDDGRLI